MQFEFGRKPLVASEVMLNVKFCSEGVFALMCIEEGLSVHYEIPVGECLIDFWVEDPNTRDGKLVEVTTLSRDLFTHKRDARGLKETAMVAHKLRQMKAMEESGLPWEVVFGEDLEEILERINMYELLMSMANNPKYRLLSKLRQIDIPTQ